MRTVVLRAVVVGLSPLNVLVHGSSQAAEALCLTSYSPSVDDVVAVVRFGRELLVLGVFA